MPPVILMMSWASKWGSYGQQKVEELPVPSLVNRDAPESL